MLWLLAIVAGAVLLGAVLRPVGEKEGGKQEKEAAPTVAPRPQLDVEQLRIRIAVLNGCGRPNLATHLMRKVRSLGFDVIDEGNAENFNFHHSLVIDRTGDLQKARQVATAVGIPHYIQQIAEETFRLEDVSIVIGRDYRRLKILEE